MNLKSLRSGFTLIEMLVVVAIIAVLAGIVLTGIGSFQAKSRDSKRIADMKIIQNYLELYNSKNGRYPTSASWSALQTDLQGAATTGVILPVDPTAGSTTYGYVYSSTDTTGVDYIIGANLETDHAVLSQDYNGAAPSTTFVRQTGNVTTWTSCANDTVAGAPFGPYCIHS